MLNNETLKIVVWLWSSTQTKEGKRVLWSEGNMWKIKQQLTGPKESINDMLWIGSIKKDNKSLLFYLILV